MKIEFDQDYVFGIPFIGLRCEKHSLNIPPGFALGVIHYPSIEQNFNHSYESWFIELYDVLLNELKDYRRDINFQHKSKYSISRMLPNGFPKRGDGKWQLLDQVPRRRTLMDYPHMSFSSLNSFDPPEKRSWYLLAHCGLTERSWSDEPRQYEDTMHLPTSEWVGEVHIQIMIYIHLIKKMKKTASNYSHNEWRSIIASSLKQLPVFKLAKNPETENQLMNEYLDNFLYDYLVTIR
ncbi:MAG: hypothetical protein IPN85_08875 [Flavobacteriales bacterium]|nr:hypothetical protein [Flavobacteriales bacterium]MBK9288559.1 hypothetical protein [Flavobacteriales bacterium]MBL0035748.1 hypothetical protein [Flavobacteriales bacterium]